MKQSLSLQIAVALTALLVTLPAHARLGENSEEITARYGECLGTDDGHVSKLPIYLFRKDGINIRVIFIEGLSANEIFTAERSGFTNHRLEELMEANSQGSRWSLVASDKFLITYKREDGAKAAVMRNLDGNKDFISFMTADFVKLTSDGKPGF